MRMASRNFRQATLFILTMTVYWDGCGQATVTVRVRGPAVGE
jgi:hypothetical protein